MVVIVPLFCGVLLVIGVLLIGDRRNPVGRHDAETAEIGSVDQPVQPAFELQAVHDEDLRLAHGSRGGRGRLVDMRVAVGADEGRDGDLVAADALHHVA